MITPSLQGVVQPVLSTEESYIYAWIIGYVILLICSCQLVASKLQRNWREMRSALYWQLGWTLLLLMFPPIFAPLVWSPVALSWIILGFLFSLQWRSQRRKSLHHGLVFKDQRRPGARSSSPLRGTRKQQKGSGGDA